MLRRARQRQQRLSHKPLRRPASSVRVTPLDFLKIVELNDEPLVVKATGGFFSTVYMYLTSYRGLAFFTKSDMPLNLSAGCQVVQAQKIWIPN